MCWSKSRLSAGSRTRFHLLLERGEDKGEESMNDKSVAEGNVHVTRGMHELAIWWDKL